MATSVKQMMEAANAAVPRITPAQARQMIANGKTLVVDVRDAPESRTWATIRSTISAHSRIGPKPEAKSTSPAGKCLAGFVE